MISNQTYLHWQRELALNKSFRRFWLFCGIYSVGFVFLASIYFIAKGNKEIVLIAFAAFVLGRMIIPQLIYLFYKKPRPYQQFNFHPVSSWFFSPIQKRYISFPSDHSISFAAITTVFFYFFPPVGIVFIILTLFNGWGRVILGYHYIIDIVAGWTIGILSAIAVIHWVVPKIIP
ncbi:MAG TPA: phosphatase PAP2 family protein [Candidatus Limnocylindria bacterium]|nr:phosphatase PAP2 family protein [Candidatus Limnocylindria bacterium]